MPNRRVPKIAGLAFAGCVLLALQPSVFADNVTVSTQGGLRVYDEQNYWFKISGRMQFDQVYFNASALDKSGYPSGSNLRRAQVALKGGFNNDFSYKLQNNFANSTTSIQEAFIAYNGVKNSTLAVGNISIPFGMEAWTSSSALTFMESSLMTNAFAPSYGLGFYADHTNQLWTVSGALFHPGNGYSSGYTDIGAPTGSDRVGASLRVVASPVHNEFDVWHFGASTLLQKVDSTSSALTFSSIPGAVGRLTPNSIATPAMTNVSEFNLFGTELAYRQGPWSLQAEIQRAKVVRTTGVDPEFTGYAFQGSYVMTGEVREYDLSSGTFDNPKPRLPMGAWELTGRFDYLGLNDKDINGGSEHNYTVGINWYVNNNLKFMGDYIRAYVARSAWTPLNGRELNIFAFRAQVMW